MNKPKTIAIIELGALGLCLGLFLWWVYPEKAPLEPGVILVDTTASSTMAERVSFIPPAVLATSAYVYDTVTGQVIYDKNADLQLPLASLTKVMTALTVSNLLPDGDIVRVSSSDLREEGDSGLIPNEDWAMKDLLDFSLVVSSNDASRTLASVAGAFLTVDATSSAVSAFVKEMNNTARGLGLSQTYFLNQSGLDVSPTLSGGYGSARDMALLVGHILKTKPHLLEATAFDQIRVSSQTETHTAVNTNKAINMIPNVIASKTGFTDLSGGNLVVAFDAGLNHPIIIAVLGSTFEGRFQDMANLVASTVEYLGRSEASR